MTMRIEQIGGALTAVAVWGRWCYAGLGARLALLDGDAPALAPVALLDPPLPDLICAIAIAPPYAFLALGRSGVAVVDCAEGAPRLTGAWQGPHAALGLDVDGDRCVVACADGHVAVLDLRNPARPVPLGPGLTVSNARNPVRGIAAAGGIACLALDNRAALLDLRDVEHPAVLDVRDRTNRPNGLARVGTDVYLLAETLSHLDLTAPGPARWLGLPIVPNSAPRALAVAPPDLYLGMVDQGTPPGSQWMPPCWTGLWHLDLRILAPPPAPPCADDALDAAPLNPPPVPPLGPGAPPPGGWTLDAPPRAIATDGRTVAALAGDALIVAEAGEADYPFIRPRHYQPPHVGQMVAADEHYGYAITGGEPPVLRVLDLHAGVSADRIADAPPLGACANVPSLWSEGQALAPHAGHLYIAHAANRPEPAGLAIYDVRDPTRPTRLADVQVGAYTELIAIAGGLLYGISPPPSPGIPMTPGVVDAPHPLAALRARLRRGTELPPVAGRYLSIYDLTDPTLPRLRSRSLLPDLPPINEDLRRTPKGLAIIGGHAAVVTYEGTVLIYALDDPASRVIASCALGVSGAKGIAAYGDRLFIITADGWGMASRSDLHSVDMQAPFAPRVAAMAPLPGQAAGIVAAAGRLFVSCGEAGIQILDALE